MPARLAADAKLVVTEAFTNAVRHAYEEPTDGHVTVEAHGDGTGITIVVRDLGQGFRARIPEPGRISGLGLSLIATLADRLELRRLPEGGTEVRARLERESRERLH